MDSLSVGCKEPSKASNQFAREFVLKIEWSMAVLRPPISFARGFVVKSIGVEPFKASNPFCSRIYTKN